MLVQVFRFSIFRPQNQKPSYISLRNKKLRYRTLIGSASSLCVDCGVEHSTFIISLLA